MVRVRKNAESLTPLERGQFLAALARLHRVQDGGAGSELINFVEAHDRAFGMGIHGGNVGNPLFLAWHRAFLLHFERELQAIDPRVALPYWRFDEPAPNLFTREFLGSLPDSASPTAQNLVEFAPGNPIFGWQFPDRRGGLRRARSAALFSPLPSDSLGRILGLQRNSIYRWINGELETGYHNDPHGIIGGWLASAASPRDPLFFLLHANVDRAWAHWQVRYGRHGSNGDLSSYSALGSYPGDSSPRRYRKGSYADDSMWPWSGTRGNNGTQDPMDDWPELSYSMPDGNVAPGPTLPPTPAGQIDFQDVNADGLGHGVCYDDLSFFGTNTSLD